MVNKLLLVFIVFLTLSCGKGDGDGLFFGEGGINDCDFTMCWEKVTGGLTIVPDDTDVSLYEFTATNTGTVSSVEFFFFLSDKYVADNGNEIRLNILDKAGNTIIERATILADDLVKGSISSVILGFRTSAKLIEGNVYVMEFEIRTGSVEFGANADLIYFVDTVYKTTLDRAGVITNVAGPKIILR